MFVSAVRPAARALAVVLVIGSSAAWADTLSLRNGDRLSGALEGIREGKATLTTGYAGPLSIDAGELTAIVTVEPVALRLEDGTLLSGLLVVEDGEQLVVSGHERHPLALGKVQALSRDVSALLEPLAADDKQGGKGEEAKPGKEPEATQEAKATEEPKTPEKWTGTVDAGASWRSGETDTVDGNISLTLKRTWKRDFVTLEASAGYGEVDSEVNTRRAKGRLRGQHYLGERGYLFAHTGAEHGPGQRLELRWDVGGGYGYEFVKNERRNLSMDFGVDYAREQWNKYSIREYEDAKDQADSLRATDFAELVAFVNALAIKPFAAWTLQDASTGVTRLQDVFDNDVEQTSRWEDNVYVRLGASYDQKLFKRSKITEKMTLLPRIDDFGEYRATSDLAFDTLITEKTSLRLNLLTEYDSDAGTGDDQFTHSFISALHFDF